MERYCGRRKQGGKGGVQAQIQRGGLSVRELGYYIVVALHDG